MYHVLPQNPFTQPMWQPTLQIQDKAKQYSKSFKIETVFSGIKHFVFKQNDNCPQNSHYTFPKPQH